MSEQWLDGVTIDGADVELVPLLEGPRRVEVVREFEGVPHLKVGMDADGRLLAVQLVRKDKRAPGGADNTYVIELTETVPDEITDEMLAAFGHLLRAVTSEAGFGSAAVESDALAVDRALDLSADIVVEKSDSDSFAVTDNDVR